MNPKRIGMRDLVQPFCVGAASMDLHCQAKGRYQNGLIRSQILWMHMTLYISRDGNISPTPACECLGIKLEPTTRSGKTALQRAVNTNTNKPSAIRIAIWRRHRNDVWCRKLRRFRKDPAKLVLAS